LHDLTYAGDLPYRLVISNRPQIDHAYPPAIVPGTRADLTLRGRNLPGGRAARGSGESGLPLDERTITVAVPKDSLTSQGLPFLNHPAAPTWDARSFQWWPPGIPEALNPVTLLSATAPVIVEHEPNDTPESAQPIARSSLVCGWFHASGDVDWFR